MVLRVKMLVLLLAALIVLTGCSLNKVVLHPIEKSDIFPVKKGTQIDENVTEKNGFFISDFYLEEVMRAKIDK